MTPNIENQEVKLVHGMRGGIPSDRMEQIHLGLPYSMALRDVLPYLADPVATPLVRMNKMQARVRLSGGWHMLNQSRIALVEAEACKSFYEERQRDHTEALYRCQYYLDDASLRLYSSCEHMLGFVVCHWALSVTERKGSSFVRVLKAAERSKLTQVREDVAKLLGQLQSSEAWEACINYRNDWVHNRFPAISGLSSDIVFKTDSDYEKEFPPEILKYVGPKKGVKMSVGIGRDISVLRETVRSAYGELFRVYEGLAKLLARDSESTTE